METGKRLQNTTRNEISHAPGVVRPEPKKPADVQVGDPCTMYVGSDRYAYVVASKSPSGLTIGIRETAWRDDVEDETFRWSQKRQGYVKSDTRFVVVGFADPYLDPHF